MKKPENLDAMLDDALGEVLDAPWTVPADEGRPAPLAPPLEAPAYPPLPVREELEPQPHGGALMRTREQPEDRDDPRRPPVLDIGLLADLAAGRKTAVQAAQAAGVTETDLQASLAVALREVPPEEIARAMGLQAAEQQLKSGALYGAVIADLVADLAAGRLKPEVKIELAKMLARVGRVEPKEDKGVGSGSGFVLNINLGAADAKPVVIDAG